MMLINLKIEIKIILSIVFFTLLIIGFERYYLSHVILNQFNESKKIRNKLLIDTVSPIVGLNITFGLNKSNQEYLNQIVHQNDDLQYVELLDSKEKIIYQRERINNKKFEKNDTMIDSQSIKIIDTLTGTSLGELRMYFSNDDYKIILKKNLEITATVVFVVLVLLMVFIILLKREFRLLKELSNNVLTFDPSRNDFKISKLQRNDEVGIINNAICTMVEKINLYVSKLDDANSSLEKTVLEKVEKITKQEKLMISQSRLALMGETMSMIAHQWRQPLSMTTLMISEERIKAMLADKEESDCDKMLEKISGVIMSLSDTIDDFQTYFKPQKSAEDICANALVQRMESFLESRLVSSKVKLTLVLYEPILIKTYASEVVQVITNIVNNAIDALEEKDSQERNVWVKIFDSNENLTITIEDDGGGVNNDIIDKIFDPYFSAKSKNGTGLGLFMAKMIIDKHLGGALSVLNTTHGACFTILLPKEPEPST